MQGHGIEEADEASEPEESSESEEEEEVVCLFAAPAPDDEVEHVGTVPSGANDPLAELIDLTEDSDDEEEHGHGF